MKKASEHEFDKNWMVYVIDGKEQTSCFRYEHYLQNKVKYEGKVLVIANPNVPVYFRMG